MLIAIASHDRMRNALLITKNLLTIRIINIIQKEGLAK